MLALPAVCWLGNRTGTSFGCWLGERARSLAPRPCTARGFLIQARPYLLGPKGFLCSSLRPRYFLFIDAAALGYCLMQAWCAPVLSGLFQVLLLSCVRFDLLCLLASTTHSQGKEPLPVLSRQSVTYMPAMSDGGNSSNGSAAPAHGLLQVQQEAEASGGCCCCFSSSAFRCV